MEFRRTRGSVNDVQDNNESREGKLDEVKTNVESNMEEVSSEAILSPETTDMFDVQGKIAHIT